MKNNSRFWKILKRILIGVFIAIIVAIGSFYIYTLDYYRADNIARNTDISKNMDDYYIFKPDVKNDKNIGFIFYPGGKVEAIAYAPLMKKLADNGITTIIVEMPFNLAVFKIKAADEVRHDPSNLGNITKWYIGGHSLGGAMASSYIEGTEYKYDGLILLGAYPINDFDIPVLAIIGSEDQIANSKEVNAIKNLIIIQGGNHANVGDYGIQKGDGKALISREKQQDITVDYINKFVLN
ncbi:MAG: alpha/beta hydrolase [Firmicutes bacterium]|nr:alpha/beta hydrolase [Bacillota bacterium]